MDPKEISKTIVAQLEAGWNNADGAQFALPFATQSDFVDIRGTLHPNSPAAAIGAEHDGIFASIYKGSRIRYEVAQATPIDTNTILAHARAELDAPVGPLAGKTNSTITLVLVQQEGDWKIRGFHNTLVFRH